MSDTRSHRIRYAALGAGILLAGLGAVTPMSAAAGTDDPLEPLNRVTFGLNRELDRFVLRPTTVVYRFALPRAARRGIGQFLSNLLEPVSALNAGLQGDAAALEVSLSRFLLNTIVGLGGFIDIAGTAGVHRDPKSFGGSLAQWGVAPGPYLVLPALGSSTARELVGLGMDAMSTPHHYLNRTAAARSTLTAAETGLRAVQYRDENFEQLDAGLAASLDPYASARSVYLQRLRARDRPQDAPVRAPNLEFDDFDDFDDFEE